MQISKVNPRYDFNDKKWVISIVNKTESRLSASGHVMIVVEGLESNQELFVAQYDIQANFFQKQNNIVNAMGYISDQN